MPIQAGGLASGLDTASIIDSLVSLQKRPIEKLDKAAQAVKVRVSAFSTISGQLTAFGKSLKTMQTDGVRATAVQSKNSSFTASTTSGAVPGQFSVEIQSLAAAARARSAFHSSETAPVRGSTLSFAIDGSTTDVTIDDGMALDDVAERLNGAGLPITAAVLFDGTQAVLSISRTTTGHAIGSAPSTALSITETVTGGLGTALGLSVTTPARNTVAMIDGLRFERQSTRIVGAVPGVNIEASALGTPEVMVVADDAKGTRERLGAFVDAYNAISKSIQGELNIKADTDRGKTLAGDPTLRLLQAQLQKVASTPLGGLGAGLKTLADLGLKSGRDGSLSIDEAVLNKAIERDGPGVDRLFAATGAIGTAISSLVENFTGADGIIPQRTTSFNAEGRRIADNKIVQERRLELVREQLVRQFTAMESIVSSMNAMSSFLTNSFAKRTES
jgi:flagellar hook-associated protein 2